MIFPILLKSLKMAGSVVQGIDTLTAAMKSNIVPDQEYLLQGSILDTHLEVLQHRLRGLCDGGEEMVTRCFVILIFIEPVQYTRFI